MRTQNATPLNRRRAGRYQDLVDAAVRSFASTGVAGTSVDDIVRAAGVAKGTFYLYFETRDDIVTAVAERLVEGVGRQMDAALAAGDRPASDRIRGIAGAMAAVGSDPYERDLVAALHQPGNASVHDRLSGQIIDRLLPAVAEVIAGGIATGEFVDQEPRQAAAFVLGCFTSIHDLVTAPDDLGAVVDALNAFVLRGLGHRAAAPR